MSFACCLLPIVYQVLSIVSYLLSLAFCQLSLAYCLLSIVSCPILSWGTQGNIRTCGGGDSKGLPILSLALLSLAYCLLPIFSCLLSLLSCLLSLFSCLLSLLSYLLSRGGHREIFTRAGEVIAKVPADGSPASEPRVVDAFRAFAVT